MKRTISTLLTTLALSFIALPTMATIANTQKDKLSYAIGVQTGRAFKMHKVNLNPQAFSEGLEDATAGKPYQLSAQEMSATLAAFRKDSLEKLQKQVKHLADKNAQKGTAFLAANGKTPGVKTTKTGLQYKILKRGRGTPPSLSDIVTVNYKGTLINGRVFDSSYKRGKPATFPVRGVIRGWREALTMMKPGAVWMLYIPSKLAYGTRGAPGAIGPNETLIFKVNLISVRR